MFKKINRLKNNNLLNIFCSNNSALFCVTLTHTGPTKMVNVGNKTETLRYAKASCLVKLQNKDVIELIKSNLNAKGDVFRASEFAGIMAAKKTSELIPLCHQINLSTVNIKIEIKDEKSIYIESYAETRAQTGVEMEAMVGVSVAALTLYDMCKAADKTIEITEVKLLEKFGGKTGHFVRKV